MDLEAGTPLRDVKVDTVFVGSCTNGRIEDLRAAAEVIDGRKVADGVRMLVVPGSMRVREQAEKEGLDAIFTAAGAEWRQAGCSMCLGMNPDQLAPGERSASTSNRNFEGRQGKGGRTHLVSPLVAAATAVPATSRSPADPARASAKADDGQGSLVSTYRHRGAAAPQQCRHRPDHPGRVPEADHPHRLRGRPVQRLAHNEPDFVLNQEQYNGATILVAGPDFGTGSSREHAVWALLDYGFRAVIAPRFGDIFRGNSLKAGLLTVVLPEKIVQRLWDDIEDDPRTEVTVDVVDTQVRWSGEVHDFELDDYTRWRLMEGLDDIGITLRHSDGVTRTRPHASHGLPTVSV